MSDLPDFFIEMWAASKNYIPQKDRYEAEAAAMKADLKAAFELQEQRENLDK